MAETLVDTPPSLAPAPSSGPDFRIWTAGVDPVDLEAELHLAQKAGDSASAGTLSAAIASGFPRVQAVGSSTVQDLQGDTMEVSALQDMAEAEPGLPIWVNHSYIDPEDRMGMLARKPTIKWDQGIADVLLLIDLISTINPRAEQLYKGIKAGVRQGTSVGCQVTAYEWRTAKGVVVSEESLGFDDVASGAVTLFILHVLPVEWSFVGIPANQRSWVVDAAKGMFERTLSPLLAPIVRGFFPTEYERRVRHLPDGAMKKTLTDIPGRVTAQESGRQLLWNPRGKSFEMSGKYGRMTPLSRDQVIEMLSQKSADSDRQAARGADPNRDTHAPIDLDSGEAHQHGKYDYHFHTGDADHSLAPLRGEGWQDYDEYLDRRNKKELDTARLLLKGRRYAALTDGERDYLAQSVYDAVYAGR